jgi:PKD repeat protein
MIRTLSRALPVLLMLILVACPSGTEIKVNNPPVLQALNVDQNTGVVPLSINFSWIAATDPDNDPIYCSLDTNNDGVLEFPNIDCSSITSQSFSYQNVGNFVAKLSVSDNKGATVNRMTNVVVTAPAVPGSYSIVLYFAPGFPDKFKPAFQAAATRWQSMIVADVPDSTKIYTPSNFCGLGQQSINGVDDLAIWVNTIKYDPAKPNLLGQAGPCYYRAVTQLTAVGEMEFVDTQMDGLFNANQLTGTVMHEMGHILGLGTHWKILNLTANTLGGNFCGTDPQYIGANALREYRVLGGTGNIKLENLYGPGTCEGHWKESVFGTELMTGLLNANVANPLSRMTLASMQDLGYNIDLSKADSYSIPAAGTASVSARVGKNDLIVTRPVEQVVP